jgi:SMI1-KNR4 cell-wall
VKKEVLYYFTPSEPASHLIDQLLRMKERGEYVGFTYPPASTHTCFNVDQESKLKQVINSYLGAGLRFECAEYFRGNLSGKDFGISTFRQPVVQWCPDLTITSDHKKVFNKKEPWGLTMDGVVALPVALREIIQHAVLGLNRIEADGQTDNFDLYRIQSNGVPDFASEDHTKSPMTVDGSVVPISRDIWKYKSGVILCSQRLGKLLNKLWEGLPDVKFQPVICSSFSKQLSARLSAPISAATVSPSNALENVRVLEKALQIKFPENYIDFLVEHPTSLPMGWLKIDGGTNSMLMKTMRQEQRSAAPPMPAELVPIYAYGNGDYVCLRRSLDDSGAGVTFVDWFHEDGSVEQLFEGDFEALIEDLN